ncbi:MAG: DUF6489 family protein [Gammaproteobacteria bacterium]
MKISIEVDATPAEVREFFGLPDLKPLQEGLINSISENMKTGAAGFDPFTVIQRPMAHTTANDRRVTERVYG